MVLLHSDPFAESGGGLDLPAMVQHTRSSENIAMKGAFPNLYSVYNDPDLKQLAYWEASMAAYEISTTRPRIPEWNEMNEELMLQISKVMSDQATPKEALDAAAAKYEEILKGKLPVLYQ
jgi:multiple sugar transport system substrate-binding protein